MMEWTVQDSAKYWGQEIETWKSDAGEWGYAYGVMLGGVLVAETLITGFATEEAAREAAEGYCLRSAQEAAADAGCE
jgi:hypothetical protein